MQSIRGEWALVTGASRGIGREIALALAKEGANLVVHSRQIAHTEDLVAELEALGVKAFAVEAELSDEAAVRQMAKDIQEKVTIELLFNNAGVQPKLQSNPWDVSSEEYIWAYQVNVIAPLILMEAFLPSMLEADFGRIVNTTSGIKNQPEQGAYAASKGALDKITKDYAGKLVGSNVTLNVADPGWIRTDLGGPNASHAVDTVIPEMIVGAFAEKGRTGQWISAQKYRDHDLETAVKAFDQG
ncbi:SDR family NAD(P)-dependent oxidoreductase [Streptococcus ovuberis]|uniref:SDR family oxidoreductase n=1 Tax=Streptococcus ovuberis TaxID=1936207 RepID=A0A7X6MZR1_9STRE|nr:SDR family oxidoreductase [Streptococcus ovuberis]NKZ20783.1 SDR family oxidoreductase [Streptococcus ovuberis]